MFQKGNSVSSFPFEIERQARMKRSHAGSACVPGVMQCLPAGAFTLGASLVRAWPRKWVLRGAMRGSWLDVVPGRHRPYARRDRVDATGCRRLRGGRDSHRRSADHWSDSEGFRSNGTESP